jgi:hypothetical protein
VSAEQATERHLHVGVDEAQGAVALGLLAGHLGAELAPGELEEAAAGSDEPANHRGKTAGAGRVRGGPRDTEELGRGRLVFARLLHGGEHPPPIVVGQGAQVGLVRGRRAWPVGVAAGRYRRGARPAQTFGRQVLAGDGQAAAHQDGPLHHVAQLAHVAGPGVGGEHGERLRRKHRRLAATRPPCAVLSEELGQGHEVARALAQRGHPEDVGGQAEEQIRTERPGGDVGGEVAVGGGDEAYVDGHRAGRAHPQNLAVLEHTQELGLGGQGQLGDLVEEQRAAARGLEQPGAGDGRAGERALLGAEQLGLDEGGRQRRAVDGEEGAVAARRRAVERVGHALFADAGLTDHQHADRARREQLDGAVQLTHGGVGDDHTIVGPVCAGVVEVARVVVRVDARLVGARGFERLLAVKRLLPHLAGRGAGPTVVALLFGLGGAALVATGALPWLELRRHGLAHDRSKRRSTSRQAPSTIGGGAGSHLSFWPSSDGLGLPGGEAIS